jgi:hypothetical protein
MPTDVWNTEYTGCSQPSSLLNYFYLILVAFLETMTTFEIDIFTFIIYMYVKRYTPMNCNRSTVKQSILRACGCVWKRLGCCLYRLHPQIFPTLGIGQNFESYSILIYSESRLDRFHWICEHASKVWNISISFIGV